MAWNLVCQPKRLGGLGLHNLKLLNTALRAKWVWLARTDTERPWAGLNLTSAPDSVALFNASVTISVGSGAAILFWSDPWIGGVTAHALAPAVVALVRPRLVSQRTVQQGLPGHAWVLDIAGPLSVDATVQFFHLWDAVARVETGGERDVFRWKWAADGVFSSRSAYRLLFEGTTALPGAPYIWDSFAPMKFRLHAWLALRRRCWTADRLIRHGMAASAIYRLCSATDKTLNHLSLSCPFAVQVWAGVTHRVHSQLHLPDAELEEWWPNAVDALPAARRKEANSLIMLILRSIWIERNERVFNDRFSPASRVISVIVDEWNSWMQCRGGQLRDS